MQLAPSHARRQITGRLHAARSRVLNRARVLNPARARGAPARPRSRGAGARLNSRTRAPRPARAAPNIHARSTLRAPRSGTAPPNGRAPRRAAQIGGAPARATRAGSSLSHREGRFVRCASARHVAHGAAAAPVCSRRCAGRAAVPPVRPGCVVQRVCGGAVGAEWGRIWRGFGAGVADPAVAARASRAGSPSCWPATVLRVSR